MNTLQDDEAEDQVGQVRPHGDQGLQSGGVQGGGVRLAVGAVGQVAAKVLKVERRPDRGQWQQRLHSACAAAAAALESQEAQLREEQEKEHDERRGSQGAERGLRGAELRAESVEVLGQVHPGQDERWKQKAALYGSV